jgi:electron transfer flavoprotein alpha subunit
MRAIVLVKQVPDVRAGNVGTKPDGTIDRASAAAITNPADLHAVEAALQLADEVWAVTMGPARAESCLREVIGLGANRGVLASDRLFAGSDTWATANVLAATVRHLGGADLILCGTSALDGETGHVGPQVAQRLGMPQATMCEEAHLEDGHLVVRRIIEGGYEVRSVPLPAVVTIAETGFLPRYPTLPGRKRGQKAELTVLGAGDLDLDERSVGLHASPTKVARMEMVPMPKTECRFVGNDFSIADLVRSVGGETTQAVSDGMAGETGSHDAVAVGADQDGADVWVVCEIREGSLAPVSAELISKAVELSSTLGTSVGAVLIGSGLDSAVDEAARYGADLILVADDPRLKDYLGLPETRIAYETVRERKPEIVLMGATTTGRDLAPRLAAMLDTGIAADCTDLYIDDWARRDEVYPNLLHQVRPAMAGGVLATCLCPEKRPQIATVRSGVFRAIPHPRRPRVASIAVDLEEEDFSVEILDRSLQHAEVGLSEADVIVAGGAGCNAANWHLVEDLADAIGGRVGASRAAVEAGLAPRSRQVGQTGSTVHPSLYIACGISGALQHVVGMKTSATVVAINRDPTAPIFRFAHYGIVGDVANVLPQLTEAFAARSDNG